MPILAIGSRATGNNRGFTLVETLVVVLIIGLVAGAVIITLPGPGGALRDDARALAARATLLGQESIVSGRPTGMLLTSQGYAFYRMEAGKWQVMSDERAFVPQTWKAGVVATISSAANQNAVPALIKGKPEIVPNVMFDPTGMATRFSVSLANKDETYIVSSGERGGVGVRSAP